MLAVYGPLVSALNIKSSGSNELTIDKFAENSLTLYRAKPPSRSPNANSKVFVLPVGSLMLTHTKREGNGTSPPGFSSGGSAQLARGEMNISNNSPEEKFAETFWFSGVASATTSGTRSCLGTFEYGIVMMPTKSRMRPRMKRFLSKAVPLNEIRHLNKVKITK